MEAEFFGHERGAFTGAERAKKGYLEQADRGTLFLDEIGDLPLGMQVKLLRVIQERKVQRVGSETSIPVEILVYCATNRDLVSMVREGRFRDDLYYRIDAASEGCGAPRLTRRRVVARIQISGGTGDAASRDAAVVQSGRAVGFALARMAREHSRVEKQDRARLRFVSKSCSDSRRFV